MSEAKWYVVHTYSGYENKVKANIEKTIEKQTPGRPDSGSSRSAAGCSRDAKRCCKAGPEKNVSGLCASQHGHE